MEEEYYVYCYLDPTKPGEYSYGKYIFNYEPFYIGKGTKNRYLQHVKYGGSGTFMRRKVKKLLDSNITPLIIKLFEKINNDIAIIIEKDLIQIIGRRVDAKGPLVNLTLGGEGFFGYKRSQQTTDKIVKARMSRPKTIKEINHLKKLHKSTKGRKYNYNYGVYQINKLDSTVIAEYRTVKEAEANTNICYTNICNVCNGKRKTAGGFKWEYINKH